MEKFTNVFKSLSDKTRLRILHLLTFSKKELCICEIMDSLKLAQYNISKHIRELKLAGLVQERKEGRFVFYFIVEPKNTFHRNILQTTKAIPKNKEDIERLRKRLALRKNGKIVVGCLMNRKKCK
ncbi:MAG: winged helix-turn-helix transcriptional regulator [Elusimicrobia bacterium]|nr:winged helix-turn-helix transcriptional regulator [Elusimicrobiota bacterium]